MLGNGSPDMANHSLRCTAISLSNNSSFGVSLNPLERYLCNSGKLSLVPYTKDFGRITHF